MVKTRCLFLLLSSSLAFSCAVAFHPVALALSQRMPEGENNPSVPADEDSDPPKDYTRELLSYENEMEKRGQAKNFLRFGKSGLPMESGLVMPLESQELTEEEKRARNFLRFGRNQQRNFLRFGRGNPLQFGLGLEDSYSDEELVKRAMPNNFLRFGKAADRNFLRFGRSAEFQKKDCDDCGKDGIKNSKSPSSSTIKEEISEESHSNANRLKRSVSAFYDDAEFFPHAPMTWAAHQSGLLAGSRLGSAEPEDDISNNGQKRSHSRNFLRYGRDPLDLHFLRFGKRGSGEDDTNGSDDEEDHFTRYVRTRPNKNFLRFG